MQEIKNNSVVCLFFVVVVVVVVAVVIATKKHDWHESQLQRGNVILSLAYDK